MISVSEAEVASLTLEMCPAWHEVAVHSAEQALLKAVCGTADVFCVVPTGPTEPDFASTFNQGYSTMQWDSLRVSSPSVDVFN